mmetsp:Transcript_51425/g.115880  ORF Transcript_51425/g.115880 Transcript_51425/m.115880 type:complete len:211 (-) Transcript_51425:5-637(-)
MVMTAQDGRRRKRRRSAQRLPVTLVVMADSEEVMADSEAGHQQKLVMRLLLQSGELRQQVMHGAHPMRPQEVMQVASETLATPLVLNQHGKTAQAQPLTMEAVGGASHLHLLPPRKAGAELIIRPQTLRRRLELMLIAVSELRLPTRRGRVITAPQGRTTPPLSSINLTVTYPMMWTISRCSLSGRQQSRLVYQLIEFESRAYARPKLVL